MSIKSDLKRDGVEVVKKLDTLKINFIAQQFFYCKECIWLYIWDSAANSGNPVYYYLLYWLLDTRGIYMD